MYPNQQTTGWSQTSIAVGGKNVLAVAVVVAVCIRSIDRCSFARLARQEPQD
jgi:hypothetical protein